MKDEHASNLSRIITLMMSANSSDDVMHLADEFLHGLEHETFDIGYGEDDVPSLLLQPSAVCWSSPILNAHITGNYRDRVRLLDHMTTSRKSILWRVDPGSLTRARAIGHNDPPRSQFATSFNAGKFGLISFDNGARILSPSPHMLTSAVLIGAAMSAFDQGFISLRNPSGKNSKILESLNEAQRIALHWVSVGKTNFEISVIMALPQRRIEYYVALLIEKFQVSNRVQVVLKYLD